MVDKIISVETLSFLRSLSFSINESMTKTLVFSFEIKMLLKKKANKIIINYHNKKNENDL